MYSLEAENIHDVVKPLLLFSRLFAFTSFSINIRNGKFVQHLSNVNVLCFILSNICNLFFTVTYLVRFENLYHESLLVSEVFDTSMFLAANFFVVTTFIVIWWSILSREYFTNILNSLHEVDETLERIKSSVNFRSHKKVTILFIVSANAFIAFATAMMYLSTQRENGYLIICFYYMATYVYMGINIFVTFHSLFWMWQIKLRYQRINSYLIEVFLKSSEKVVKDGNDCLIVAAKLHERLVDASESVNKFYGGPV